MSNEIEEMNLDDLETTIRFMDVFNNRARFSIYIYLLIYHELTLDDFSELLQKSKSTIHHHLQKYIELGMIEDSIKPGSKTKYYKIKFSKLQDKVTKAFSVENFEKYDNEIQLKLCEALINYKKEQISLIQYLNNFLQTNFISVDLNEDGMWNLEKQRDVYTAINFVNDEDSTAFRGELTALVRKYVAKRKEEKETGKPWGFYIVGANYKNILDKKHVR
ncbi:MAG TPA: winged helix-turn-helix domain-containing protein [candidate division Zixibacteria bacterium]|nr:winged helix-turn-helix domain-containing protein [candidate division Zixibacteria bacterium]